MTESQIPLTLAVKKIPTDMHITSCVKINKTTSKFEILVQKMSIGCDLHLCKIHIMKVFSIHMILWLHM